jgi:hypothetical protein
MKINVSKLERGDSFLTKAGGWEFVDSVEKDSCGRYIVKTMCGKKSAFWRGGLGCTFIQDGEYDILAIRKKEGLQ